jgi:hypothetical protein
MLEIIAHSAHGIVDRGYPLITADNSLTQSGMGIRQIVPVLHGHLPGKRARYIEQLQSVARALNEPEPDSAEVENLLLTYRSAIVDRDPEAVVAIELLCYRDRHTSHYLAVGHRLEFHDEPAWVRLAPYTGVDPELFHPLFCASRRTNSMAQPGSLRRELSSAGYQDELVTWGPAVLCAALSTLVVLSTDGKLFPVGSPCLICEELLVADILLAAGITPSAAAPLPTSEFENIVGAWLVQGVSGVIPVRAIGTSSIGWTGAAARLTDHVKALFATVSG